MMQKSKVNFNCSLKNAIFDSDSEPFMGLLRTGCKRNAFDFFLYMVVRTSYCQGWTWLSLL